MNDIENLLRQAYADAAATVGPDDIARAPIRSRRTRTRARNRIVIPLMAAAATGAVALAAAVVPGVLAGSPRPAPTARPTVTHGVPPPQLPAPRYFAVLLATERVVQIRSAATGQQVFRIASPAGEFFSGVAETGDGRTLLVAVEHDTGACTTRLYRTHLDAAGRPGPLRPVSVPSIDGILPSHSLTMTPDGSRVAFQAYFCDGLGSLEILNLRTGAIAQWPTQSPDTADSLSLSADGAVLSLSGIEYAGIGPGAKPGTSSARISRVTAVLRASSSGAPVDGLGIIVHEYATAILSPNAATLYVCASHAGHLVLASYNVQTKARLRVIATWTGAPGDCVFTLAPDGQEALVADSAGHVSRLSIATGRLTSLPASGLPGTVAMTW